MGIYADFPQNTPVPPVATAVYCYDLKILAEIADVLGRTDDSEAYKAEAENVKAAYNREFFDRDLGRYCTGSQTSLCLPLFVNLVPEDAVETVRKRLIRDIELRDYGITGGDVGFPFLLRTLDSIGRNDIVMKMLGVTDRPGYGYMVKNGATTLCETWDGNKPGSPRSSQNHFMLGSIEEWFYHGLAGFKRIYECGSDDIVIEPYIPKELEWLKAWHDYPQGRAEISWKRKGDSVEIEITVPSKAILIINGARERITEACTVTREIVV